MCFTYKAEIFLTIKYKGPCKEQYCEKGCNTVRAGQGSAHVYYPITFSSPKVESIF